MRPFSGRIALGLLAAGLFFHVSGTFDPTTAAASHAMAACQK